MNDQTALAISTNKGIVEDQSISRGDVLILRELAKKVADIASLPEQSQKRDLWTRHNMLNETRPLIFCDPENGWNEIITDSLLKCTGKLARAWEMRLRKEIFWGEDMGDDKVIEPYFYIGYSYEETDWGMHEVRTGGAAGGSYRWEAPLKDYNDISKLKFPVITLKQDETTKKLELAKEVFNDLLEVQLKTFWWWSLGMTWTLINLRGLEQMMIDMYDYPDKLHELMAFLRDGTINRLDFLEDNGLLCINNDTYVGSGGFGYTKELPQQDYTSKVRTKDLWGFAESQETSLVSAEMFDEYILPYQIPILARFGLNCYGCCEPLDKRWDMIKKISRLRRVSVSPWSDVDMMAKKLGGDYVFSLKPNPAYLAVSSIDEDYIRKSLRNSIKSAKDCRLEIIMKDNHTIGKNPENVVKWCQIAREEAEA